MTTTTPTRATFTSSPTLPANLARALQTVSDTLEDCEIPHALQAPDAESVAWTCATMDGELLNLGFIGLDEVTREVVFAIFDAARAESDSHHGIPESDSKHWLPVKDVDTFLLYLNGTVRIVRDQVRAQENLRKILGETTLFA